MFLPITEEGNELIKVKIFLILWLEVREARCPFQCVNSKQRFQSHFTQDFRSIKVPQYTATRYILITTEATEQHGNFNSFHFQYDGMWPVNMTGKAKGWQVNFPVSPDIVRWPAVISSPAEKQEKSVWSRISSAESRVSVVIGHQHDGVILLLRQESVGFLLSCTN